MKPRDVSLLAGVLSLLVALGLLFVGGTPAEGMGGGPDAGPEVSEAPVPPAPAIESGAPALAPAPEAVTAARESAAHTRSDGMVRGHVSIATSVLSRLDLLTLQVLEARNDDGGTDPARPTFTLQKSLKVDPRRTPEFVLDGIPFSPHGYFVSVYAPGLNGSTQHVRLTSERPVADVVLGLSSGVPYSILVRDQLQNPLREQTVQMIPVGEPTGRAILQGQSDAFGSLVFENVLQGEWKIAVGPPGAPLGEPRRVQVVPPAGSYTLQSTTVTVALGRNLEVQVFGPSGHGLQEVELEVTATDSVAFRRYEGRTDWTGKHTFAHLPAGTYQVNARLAGHGRWTRVVRIGEDKNPDPLVARLYPE
ncbi:MAG: carboxypeptidase regulatory-like domain-containing protein [Planctomycetes bacterium]|nr:carboxypeptidase regulatory-like domain-containing protein [Planctomycetota bacterium]